MAVIRPRPNRPAGHAVAVLNAKPVPERTFDRTPKGRAVGVVYKVFRKDPASRGEQQAVRIGGPKWRSKMPKMKTKSSCKKRFKITASGKVKSAAAGKRHGMIKRSNKFIRDARGTMVLSEPDARIVKKYMPNSL